MRRKALQEKVIELRPGRVSIYLGECWENSKAWGYICVRENESHGRYVKYLCMGHLECKDDFGVITEDHKL